jgi:hypothetical protein
MAGYCSVPSSEQPGVLVGAKTKFERSLASGPNSPLVKFITGQISSESCAQSRLMWQGWNLRRGGSTCLSIDFPGVLTVPSFMLI